MTLKSWPVLFLVTFLLQRNACTEQHNPKPDLDKQRQESKVANRTQAKLTAEGTIPEKAVAAAQTPTDVQYANFCASCHGAQGDGKGTAAASLNPPPRNFQDAAWQGKVDDAHIAAVIEKGGAAAGLSATMAPWGSVLSGPDDLKNMVAKIRSFGQSAAQ